MPKSEIAGPYGNSVFINFLRNRWSSAGLHFTHTISFNVHGGSRREDNVTPFSTDDEMKAASVNLPSFTEPASGRAGSKITVSFPNARFGALCHICSPPEGRWTPLL